MPSIIAQELVEILKQLLIGVQQKTWLSFKTTDGYNYNLQTATNLNALEYKTILFASGILFKKGNTTMVRKAKLDYLQTTLKENIDLHITLSKIETNGNKLFFIAVERPTFRNPLEQAKANPRVLPNRRGNGLNEAQLRLLERLCAERATGEEPELIVEGQLHPPPQIQEQYEQENEPPQAEEAQERRPARGRRVLQELQLQPVLERRARRRADETQQEEANQIRLHRRAVAQEEHQLHLPPERRIRPRRNDNVKHPRRGIKNSSIA